MIFFQDTIVLDQRKNIVDFLVGNKDPQDQIDTLIADWDLWAASMKVKAVRKRNYKRYNRRYI